MSITEFLMQPVWQRLALMLLHFLWQGLAVVATAIVIVQLSGMRHGAARYTVYLAAMIIMAACPVATFLATGTPAGTHLDNPSSIRADDVVAVPANGTALIDEAHATTAMPSAEAGVTSEIPLSAASSWRDMIKQYLPVVLPWVSVVWTIGVMILSTRLMLGVGGIFRLRRALQPLPDKLQKVVARLSTKMGMRRFSRVYVSNSSAQAMAIGFFKPIVLVPVSMLTQMCPDMLEAVIAHELAHIRRLDLWVNLLQRIIETMLFFHPAVWWLSAQVRSERELCCDELAVSATGRRLTYASALEYTYFNTTLTKGKPVLSVAACLGVKKMNTLKRVRHILGLSASQSQSRWWLAGTASLLMVLAISLTMGISYAGSNSAPETDAEENILTIMASSGKADKASASIPMSRIMYNTKVRRVNKTAFQFSDKMDTSSPEAACAGLIRAIARQDAEAAAKLHWTMEAKQLGQFSREKSEVLKKSVIVEVLIYDDRTKRPDCMAMVVCREQWPGRKPQYSLRSFGQIEGKWKMFGGAPSKSIDEARLLFFQRGELELLRFYEKTATQYALKHPEVVTKAAEELFEVIRKADYEKTLKHLKIAKTKGGDSYKKFPTTGRYYSRVGDGYGFTLWYCNTFKDNPIVSVKLDKVFKGTDEIGKSKSIPGETGLPTVPYELTLKDGRVLKGNLPFKCWLGKWQGLQGLDWHLKYPKGLPAKNAGSASGSLNKKLKGYVEWFFSRNYRDITARKTIEWGQPKTLTDGNLSIRYKYQATIWDKKKIINNQVFTFTPAGKFVSVKDILSTSTSDNVKRLVERFFSRNYRDITARKTIEWGKLNRHDNGNVSIRYKYQATIRDKKKIIQNKVFTFTPAGEYVSVKDAK